MDIVHAPIARCETRMRRLYHFSKDDPLYWPQPFHIVVAHLAVIPCPSDTPDHPLRWAWYHPMAGDLETINFPGLTGMVRLAQSLLSEIHAMCNTFLQKMAKLPQEHLRDGFMNRGRDQLRKYLERLSEPGSSYLVCLQFACLQRTFLETYARSQWLEKWAPRLLDVDKTFEVDPHIMGAFTGELSVAADLFRIGIPVWLVRRLDHHSMTKILRVVAPLDERSWDFTLPLRDSYESLDVAHENPPHPLIYRGLPGSYKRYARMSIFVHQQFASSLIGTFGTQELITPSASRMNSSSTTASTTASILSESAARRAPATPQMESLDVTSLGWIAPTQQLKKRKTGKHQCFIINNISDVK